MKGINKNINYNYNNLKIGIIKIEVLYNKTINKIFKYSKYLKRLNIVCKKS